MKTAAVIGLLLLLAACSGPSRPQPVGTFFNPVCMPDGSVVYTQLADADGTFSEPLAKVENCPWYKKP